MAIGSEEWDNFELRWAVTVENECGPDDQQLHRATVSQIRCGGCGVKWQGEVA